MNYEGVLKFKGTWRSYQARVLEHVGKYLADGKIHIVAAPGSGKTTLGIELIRRMNGNALILAPSITIREQWVARIREAFLCDGCKGEDYLSQDLKNPKAITVATYQALHSAMTRFQGTEKAGEDDAVTTEEVDYVGFDLVAAMQNAGIEILCLDECHHLRSEWWKALEEFKSKFNNIKTISLTATPPYDSTSAMWTRYMNMCGEIDEEITIPELVKEGSLCPHQDYVYFNYPTKAEEQEVRKFTERSNAMMQNLMRDEQLLSYIRTHKGLNGQSSDDLLLDDPAYLSSILIYLQSRNVAFPSRLQRLLGAKRLPDMSIEWMERLLQGFLYDDADSYVCDKTYREMLTDQLKAQGLIEKRKVVMTRSAAVEKLLTNSLGKCNSIRDIVFHEYQTTGDAHFLTGAVTNIFAQGVMQVLIGTKSLLGEGWDSPCINSLILASFVGSFMLSNQMRGRAIRVWRDAPDKTSNIWHLVCLKPWNEVQKKPEDGISEDYTLLERRMEHFLGLHYTEDTIENGMDRLSIVKPPFNKMNVDSINKKMLAMSGERASLKERWNRSLAVYDKMEVVDEDEVADKFVTTVVFWDAIRTLILCGILSLAGVLFIAVLAGATDHPMLSAIGGLMIVSGIVVGITRFPKVFMLGSPLKRLRSFGNGIRKALELQNLLEEPHCKVVSDNSGPDVHMIYLSGGSGRDKALFAQCVNEFFAVIDNQRYLLVKAKGHRGLDGFYAVPECFAKRKEDAQQFANRMRPYIGNYELVYTRNESGRALLLEGRVRALANREERCISRKKVKGALE